MGPSARLDGRALLAAALLALAACGEGAEPIPPAAPFSDPGFVEAGDWRMDYALTPSLDLPSGIAGSYGMERRPDLALLVITLAPRDPRAPAPSDAPEIAATAIGLTGERTALALARFDEGGRPTWLASVAVRHRVPLTIEIRARATAAAPELRARLTREFRVD